MLRPPGLGGGTLCGAGFPCTDYHKQRLHEQPKGERSLVTFPASLTEGEVQQKHVRRGLRTSFPSSVGASGTQTKSDHKSC